MDFLKKFYPHAFKAKDLPALIIALLVYIVGCGIVDALLSFVGSVLPLIGFVFGIAAWVVGIYGVAGIILSLLKFFKVV